MNLKSLDIAGFKTFARRTEVQLSGGVTGIVGPNGSGKSNLADALRWVLGEQSLQHIRSKKTEDVIFAGGANRPPLGMAEVTLTLDNMSGWIPLDFSEVTLARRAYRSGDNEYFINGSRVRLRDLTDLRNRAGFGQSSYSVIGQGLVDSVLSQRPEERRALFEEAAGIRHYQSKRDQTLDQLHATQQNLLRVQDIVAEIAPRVDALRRQSEKARQHAQLVEELRTLQIRWFAGRQRLLRRQSIEAEGLLADAQRSLAGAGEQVRKLEIRAAALDTDRQAVERSLSLESQRAAELRRRQEQLQGQIDLAKDKLRFMAQQGQDVDRELAELSATHRQLEAQRLALAAELSTMRAAEQSLAGDIQQAEQASAARAASLRQVDQRLQQAREQLSHAAGARNAKQRENEQLEERRGDLLRQAQQHDQDMHRKHGLVQALAEKQTSLQREILALRGQEEQMSGEVEAARLAASSASAAVTDKAAELEDLRRGHHELATRLQLLQELQSNLEGLAEGARSLLKSGRPGIVGSLAERLKVQPGYERAIAAALGHKLNAVLVDDLETARSLLQDGLEEATLLPRGMNNHPGALPRGEGVTPATSVATGADRILANVGIVENLERTFEHAFRVVTLDGDVVDPDGSITRRGVAAGEAILKRQQTLDELARKVDTSDKAMRAADAELTELRQQACEQQARLHELEEEGKRRSTARQQRVGQARDVAQQIQGAQAQVDWLASLKEQVERQAEALDLRRTGLIAEMDQSAERIPELRQELDRREAEASALRTAGDDGAQRLSELRLELGVTRQGWQHASAQMRDLQQQAANAERQLAARQKRSDEHAGILAELNREVDGATSELGSVTRQLGEQEQLIPPLRNRLATTAEELKSLHQSESVAREELAEADKRCYRAQFDSQRKHDELDGLAASLLEDLQLTPDLLPDESGGSPQPSPEGEETAPSKREVDNLKARIGGLGPINPGALEEYQEVEQRHAFLTTQTADLEGAAQQLRTVIAELEELTRRQFLETFEQVAAHFERFFKLMFNGGEVQIFLSDPDSVNTTGVEILAQPPGKRLQALPLLSGGERALVASALLFAILATKPVPFCLLDEVDAALDEANVKRFCQGLKSLAQETQFVVITHNRETMAVADALYGVSMSQDGVSKLVSLRLPREPEEPSPSVSPGAEGFLLPVAV